MWKINFCKQVIVVSLIVLRFTCMNNRDHFTSVTFKNFKAFKNYSVSLKDFNILVGPNNSGKSTILSAFRILYEGLRKASSRKPEFIDSLYRGNWGYRIELLNLPISNENIFYNYDDSSPAIIKFRLHNAKELHLFFNKVNECYLFCDTQGKQVRSPSQFKNEFNVKIGFVPVLGPVDYIEPLYQKEAARLALVSSTASRNFRNIWYYYNEYFENFRDLVLTTWPGMDIQLPELVYSSEKTKLIMFCPEERFPREIYWAGFGFQVWAQMLTFIVQSKDASIFIIDEPDIYLHSDLQRQLVSILKSLGPDILIATHSTEIISEADPDDILVVNKIANSAHRIKNPSQLQTIFGILGSNLNPTLTQLAKTRRAVFVEGKDFQILSLFSRKLKKEQIATRSDFATIPVEGFNPLKVRQMSEGIEFTLGSKIVKAVIFDHDYRTEEKVKETLKDLKKISSLSWIHSKKEIENYLLIPDTVQRAIIRQIEDRNKRTGEIIEFKEDILSIFESITDDLKKHTMSQLLLKKKEYIHSISPHLDETTITEQIIEEFESLWDNITERLDIVSGKKVFASLNNYLQENYNITLTPNRIISVIKLKEIPDEIKELIKRLDEFRKIDYRSI